LASKSTVLYYQPFITNII